MIENRAASAETGSNAVTKLTDRQRDCLQLLARGLRVKEIAIELGISPETVKQHLASARKMMGVSSSVAAARALQTADAADFTLPVSDPPNGVNPPPDLVLPQHIDASNPSSRVWQRWLGPFGWLVPAHRGAANDLSLVQRSILLILLPLAIVMVTVGALSSYETLERLLIRLVS